MSPSAVLWTSTGRLKTYIVRVCRTADIHPAPNVVKTSRTAGKYLPTLLVQFSSLINVPWTSKCSLFRSCHSWTTNGCVFRNKSVLDATNFIHIKLISVFTNAYEIDDASPCSITRYDLQFSTRD
jgi:hypothetical protein